jgi:hypothetical protein
VRGSLVPDSDVRLNGNRRQEQQQRNKENKENKEKQRKRNENR